MLLIEKFLFSYKSEISCSFFFFNLNLRSPVRFYQNLYVYINKSPLFYLNKEKMVLGVVSLIFSISKTFKTWVFSLKLKIYKNIITDKWNIMKFDNFFFYLIFLNNLRVNIWSKLLNLVVFYLCNEMEW